MSDFDDPVSRLLDDLMGTTFGASTAVRPFQPAVDVRTDDLSIWYELDIPGVKLEDLDIHLENGVMTISGERTFVPSPDREQRVLLGRPYGRFSQSFVVPDWADLEQLEARLSDGVLTISVPKREAAKRRKIQVLPGAHAKQLTGKSDDEK